MRLPLRIVPGQHPAPFDWAVYDEEHDMIVESAEKHEAEFIVTACNAHAGLVEAGKRAVDSYDIAGREKTFDGRWTTFWISGTMPTLKAALAGVGR